MSEVTTRVTAKFNNGEEFASVGEVVFHDKYVVVYDIDGATGYLFYGSLLWLLTETEVPKQAFEPPF
ncbi:hypothetical protein OV320_7803 [Actinobacteria bacterium OV320]|jgi:hypothetical protein|nr:hypothetical protein OV320_7803 [Actinobacteria bacterium OV320]